MRKQHEAAAAPSPATTWPWNEGSVDAMLKGYGNWADNFTRLQDESLRFLRQRLERNLDNANQLATCKSPAEMIERQMRFAGDTVNDYMSEGQKMMELMSRTPTGVVTKPSTEG